LESVTSSGSTSPAAAPRSPATGKFLPGLGKSDPDEVRARADYGSHQRLSHGGLAVGHQHLRNRDRRSFPELLVVGHVLNLLRRKCDQHAWPALSSRVFTRTRDGAGAQAPCRWTTTVGPRRGAHAETPRQPLAKEESLLWWIVVSAMSSPARPGAAIRARRQAGMTGLARRILHRPQARQVCSSKRPRAAQRQSERRARALPGGSSGNRVEEPDSCASGG